MNVTTITDDYDNMTLSKSTNSENIIDIFIPALLLRIPGGLSFSGSLSFMVDTLIKPYLRKK